MSKSDLIERVCKLASKRICLLRMIRIRRLLKRIEVLEKYGE